MPSYLYSPAREQSTNFCISCLALASVANILRSRFQRYAWILAVEAASP